MSISYYKNFAGYQASASQALSPMTRPRSSRSGVFTLFRVSGQCDGDPASSSVRSRRVITLRLDKTGDWRSAQFSNDSVTVNILGVISEMETSYCRQWTSLASNLIQWFFIEYDRKALL